jgi:Ca2+-binding EF-hand superfamily protein
MLESMELVWDDELLRGLLKKFDTNGDGQLDFEEFGRLLAILT